MWSLSGFRKPVEKRRWTLGPVQVDKTTESLVLRRFTGCPSAWWAKRERLNPVFLDYMHTLRPWLESRVTAIVSRAPDSQITPHSAEKQQQVSPHTYTVGISGYRKIRFSCSVTKGSNFDRCRCGFWALRLLTVLCEVRSQACVEQAKCDSLLVWGRLKGEKQHLLRGSPFKCHNVSHYPEESSEG